MDIFRKAMPLAAFTPVVGGQPNLGRYCLFGNLFAAYQTGGEVHRIDRHPTMSRHPVTPMHEADLRLHLDRLGLAGVVSVSWPVLEQPLDEALGVIDGIIERAPGAVLFDAARAQHLGVIGRVIRRHAHPGRPVLAVGPSSVLQCLIEADRAGTGAMRAAPPVADVAPGPALVLSGSLSPVTAGQIHAATDFDHFTLESAALLASDARHLDDVRARVRSALRAGRHALVRLSSAPVQTSGAALAQASGAWLNGLLAETRPARLGLAGGDTSSFGIRALDIWGLRHAGGLAPGVPLCIARSDSPALDGLPIMLKGGQMGPPDIFARLIRPARVA